ncbi:MAG: spore coat protein U domain-containing protein [Spirochaetia bacterium]|nr:spore coat protein U domain-containing protein [Spirochaetia bacterium]
MYRKHTAGTVCSRLCKFLPLMLLLALIPLQLEAKNTFLNILGDSPPPVLYEGAPITNSYTFDLDYGRGGSTDAFLTFSAGNSGNFISRQQEMSGSNLEYQLYDASEQHILKDLSGYTENTDLLYLTAINPGTITVEYILSIPGSQFPPGGTYSDEITVQSYIVDGPDNYTLKDTKTFIFSTMVNSYIRIALVSSGSPFSFSTSDLNLDFGELLPGKMRSFDTIVESSVPYTVFLSSENSGAMVLDSSPNSGSEIPYTLRFNGDLITVSSTEEIVLTSSDTPTEGEGMRYPTEITIGNFGDVETGTYQDILTFTIEAN